MPKRLRKWLRIAGLCLLIFVILRWFEYSQVYHPDRVFRATGAALGRPYEDVTFAAGDGVKLNGWFYPAKTNSPRARLVVLLCHGNGGNIGDRLESCRAILETGVGVFLLDYRGYGRSQGRPSEEGTYLDAVAAHQWLTNKGFAATNIIALGESLGGGVASELAVRAPLGGLILQSTYSSIVDLGAELYPFLPVRWLAQIRYESCTKLTRLKVPVLVMHSRADEMIPFRHAQTNFAAANEPKLFWELKGDHNGYQADQKQFTAGVDNFLQLIERAGARNSL